MIRAIVGSGGKTSFIKKMAAEYRKQGRKVFVTTSTHMFVEKDTLATENVDNILKELQTRGYVMAGTPCGEKIRALPYEVYEEVCKYADEVLIEADGSKHLPLKFPNKNEPVIYENVEEIIVVCGLHGLEKPASEVVHRLELAKIEMQIEDDEIIKASHVQELLKKGYLEPLREKYENKGDGWDEDDEDDGFLPWIEDPEDDSNRCYTGIPGRIVMAPGLRRLFEKTFSKEGQQNPETRPSMQEWYTELRHANDLTIKCGKCGNTYIMSNHDAKCPFCNNEERKPVYYCQIIDTFDLDMLIKRANKDIDQFNEDGDFAVENIEIEDISNNKTIGMRLIDSYDGTYYLYNYHTDDIPFSFQVEPTVEIKFDNGKITLTNKSMNDMHLRSKNTDYGAIISGGSKRLDELDGLVLSMPVLYGKKEHLSEDIVVIDDITLLRTRNIRFIKL